MFVFAPHLTWALLISALLSADVSAPTAPCVPQEIPNMVIDVSTAVAKGARFTDPLKTADVDQCISACCSKINALGDRTCNLAIFDNRIRNAMQNCYLFYCPEPESCPMSSTPGVLSYSFWTVKEKSNVDLTREDVPEIPESKNKGKVQNSSDKKPNLGVQEADSSEPKFEEGLNERVDTIKKTSLLDVHAQNNGEIEPLPKEDKANTPDHIASKLLHLANNIDKQLEKIEADSKNVKDSVEHSVSPTHQKPLVEPTTRSRVKESKKLSSDTKSVIKKPETLEVHYPAPKLITSAPSVRTSQQTTTAVHHPVQNTKVTLVPSTVSLKQSKAPISEAKVTKVLSDHNSANSFNTAATVKNLQTGHVKTTQVPTSKTILQAKPALSVTKPKPIQTSPLKTSKPTLEDGDHNVTDKDMQQSDQSVPELSFPGGQDPSSPAGDTKDVPQNLDARNTNLGDSDKSGLIAALAFGVMFLVLIIGLVSHKVSEARRRHQYTKLDYLINGMYVDT